VPYNGGSGMDISELTDCHFAKLDLGAQFDAMLINWSSKEEEEEEVSKSLRHFEASAGGGGTCDKRAAVTDCRWDDDERTKSCIRCVNFADCIVQRILNLVRTSSNYWFCFLVFY
jgi:hypothetical protein